MFRWMYLKLIRSFGGTGSTSSICSSVSSEPTVACQFGVRPTVSYALDIGPAIAYRVSVEVC